MLSRKHIKKLMTFLKQFVENELTGEILLMNLPGNPLIEIIEKIGALETYYNWKT